MVLPLWSDTKIHLDGDGWVLPPLGMERNCCIVWLHFNFWCTDLDSMDYKPCWVDWSMDNEAIDNLNKYSSFLLLFRKVVILL